MAVPGPDMYTSLQTGLIDSMIIFLSVMDSLKLFEVAPNFVDVSFGAMTVTSLTMNNRKFSSLPKDVQDIIVAVGRETEIRGGVVTRELNDKMLQSVKAKGINISTVSDSDRKAWAEILMNSPREVARKYEAENKLPMQRIMKAYIEATEAAGYKWPVKAQLD